MMKVSQVLEWLNAFAPFDTAESFDNVGLLMGSPDADVQRLLFGMDLTEKLAEEAVRLGAELIITHHPFIFRGLKHINYMDPQGRTLCMLAQHEISVIAAHTNYDRAPGGICDSLASVFGLTDVESPDPFVRVGTLPSPLSLDAFKAEIRHVLHTEARCYPASDKPVTRLAVSGGAYGEGYAAALAAGADAYLVGEIKHHEILDACARGLTILDAGHYPTELPGVISLYERFLTDAAAAGWTAQAHLHSIAPYEGALLAF